MTTLRNGDCLVEMAKIPDKSVDMILCDLPYGTTRNKWDSVIPLDNLWTHYKRIIKTNGAVVLFAQTPFDKVLGCSNLEWLKYEWIWEKENGTGHLNSNFAPMKIHENILVFSDSAACFVKNQDSAMTYNPQFTKGKPYKTTVGGGISKNYDTSWQKKVVVQNDGMHYRPTSILKFNRDDSKVHPTQKPVTLCRYLIRTYTNEGDTVLDNTMGSGTTGVACVKEKRNFIGIELNEEYFKIAQQRIRNEEAQLTLF